MILKNKTSGETHVMAHNVFTAGSGAVNNLMLAGDHVRKIHFQILKQGTLFKLMAMNGTVEINGNLVAEHLLSQGDEIKAGAECFVAEFPQADAAPEPAAQSAVAGNPYERLLDGVINLLDNPDKRRSSEEILSLGMELMEADGGYLFSVEAGGLSLIGSVPEDNDSYSHSAVNAALKNRETLIWSAIDGTGGAGAAGEVSAQSIAHKNIHSILVSPLSNRVSGQVIGLLYLHRKRPDSPFSEAQRKLFARISQLLGGVLGTNQTQIEQAERIETLKEIKGTGDLVYSSPEMGKVVEAAKRTAASNVPVLITGETGTGKDVLANFIHAHSTRQGKPFIAVNCGAIPENLIESELFGHEKGAFTGARQ